MSRQREFDEDEVQQLREDEQDLPRGWQPDRDTIAAIQGQSDGTHDDEGHREGGEWVDRGIQDVRVDEVDLKDSPVQDNSDFQKVSHEEMVEGFRVLKQEVEPAVDQGADGEYFSRQDEQRGLDYEHGSRRVYDAFYGDSAIRLEKDGQDYNVINGYHRLAVAQELDLDTVPAHVIEKTRR